MWRLYGGICDSFILFILEDRGPDLIIHVIFDLDPISYRKIQAGYDKVVRSRSYKIWSKFGGPGMNVQIDECHPQSNPSAEPPYYLHAPGSHIVSNGCAAYVGIDTIEVLYFNAIRHLRTSVTMLGLPA